MSIFRSSLSRQCFSAVDTRVPQRDLGAVGHDADRAVLREQAREPRAQKRIIREKRDFDRIGHGGDRKVGIAGHWAVLGEFDGSS
jgi:hypothetical protein